MYDTTIGHKKQDIVPVQSEMGATARLVYFDGCAGMFHVGKGADGILILPPYGHEELACRKTLRLLAESLNSRGYHVLRLDFPGTGDAPGDESETDMLASRTQAAIAAAQWMRTQAHIEQLDVIGVRLGASIALLAGEKIRPNRCALVSPVLRGRAFLRELQQIHSFYASGPAEMYNAEAHEYNGFKFSASSVSSLNAMDLRQAAPPADRIALLASGADAGVEQLALKWEGQGAQAFRIAYEGSEQFLADPASTPPEMQLVDLMRDWLGESSSARALPASPGLQLELSGEEYRESGVRFGSGSLFGVLCRPVIKRPDAPVIIIVNTGGNSHIGWGRQTVGLARALSREGIVTLRMDIAGVGESADASGRGPLVVYDAAASADVLEAAAYLRQLGYPKPALLGICSGAFLAFNALRDCGNLSGALLVNLQKFEWKQGDELVLYSSISGYVSRLFDRDSLNRLLRGEIRTANILRNLVTRLGHVVGTRLSRTLEKARSLWTKREADSDTPLAVLTEACRKGLILSMAYTQGDGGIDEMRGELGHNGRLVRKAGDFRFHLIKGADHNFSTATSRRKLYPIVLDFVGSLEKRRS